MNSKLWLSYSEKGELLKLKSMYHNLKYLNINSVTEIHQSGLMLAISHNHFSVIDYLIHIGCDLDIEDDYGENALSLAIRFNNRKLMKTLYSKGCQISTKLAEQWDQKISFEIELLEQEEIWNRVKSLLIFHLKIKRVYVYSLKKSRKIF